MPNYDQFIFLWPVLVLAYLIGSIPFGLVFTKIAGYGDIRKIGSGNIGATNVLRTGNKRLAALTLLFDFLKGLLGVKLAVFVFADHAPLPQDMLTAFAAFAVVMGHMFPVWLKFKGGKGVATTLGAIAALHPVLAICLAVIWTAMLAAFRYSSLSAVTAAVLTLPLTYFVFDMPPIFRTAIFVLVMFVLFRHKGNILRLLRGQESKIAF